MVPLGTCGNCRAVKSYPVALRAACGFPIESSSSGTFRNPTRWVASERKESSHEKRGYFSRYRRRRFAFIRG